MRRLIPSFLVLAVATAAPLPAAAQSVEVIDAVEVALWQAWDQTPLTFRNAQFVTEAVTYGIYTPRADAVFKAGESLLVYAEPVGYGFKDNGDGTYSFGVDIDLAITDTAGGEVANQKDFASAVLSSRRKNREFIVAITLDLEGAPAGDYVLEYTARDIASDESAAITLPFTVAE